MQQVIFEPVSNKEDWVQQCEVRNSDTNALVDLTAAVIVLAVRDPKSKINRLLAQTSDGSITIVSSGIFQFTFPASQMGGMEVAKTYDVGCTIKLNGSPTLQF